MRNRSDNNHDWRVVMAGAAGFDLGDLCANSSNPLSRCFIDELEIVSF